MVAVLFRRSFIEMNPTMYGGTWVGLQQAAQDVLRFRLLSQRCVTSVILRTLHEMIAVPVFLCHSLS